MFLSVAECRTLLDPPFGTVTVTGQQLEDEATYECNTGFELVGPPTRTCELQSPGNADWSGDEPTCRRMLLSAMSCTCVVFMSC